MLSMGLGEYLSSNTKAKHWDVEYAREQREVREMPHEEEEEIYEIFDEYDIPRNHVTPIVDALKRDPKKWVDVSRPISICLSGSNLTQFMMAFELKLEKPKRRTAWICAAIMGLSYLIGGIIPMIPYFAFKKVNDALFTSIAVTVIVLIIFGYVKAVIAGNTRKACFLSSVQTLGVGVLAAGTSYGIVYGINKRLSGGIGLA
jgi:vacuolar iron transporter family protein